ncbi:MAG TPA: hypothetical protein VFS20_24695 [Longimicrobium sp.]|nr:hypothetical protein [Longimicrobium sp.]
MKPFLRTTAAAAILALGACKSWQPQPLVSHPRQQFTGDARVYRNDSSMVVLRHPVLAGDSLAGNTGIAERIAIPLSDIRTVYTRRPDAGRTFLAIGAAALAAYVIYSESRSTVVY